MKIVRGKRWIVAALAILLAAVGLGGISNAGTDPEPQVIYKEGTIAPGPGWPAGWTPPPAPKEIPEGRIEAFNTSNSHRPLDQRYERLELRVLSPMPEWTQQYPYRWEFNWVACGKTAYDYAVPVLDIDAIWTGFKATYSAPGVEIGPCQIAPLHYITRDKDPDVDPEQERLYEQVGRDTDRSQSGLEYGCGWGEVDGKLDDIHVCFNGGNASRTFDAPAYADVSVGRVRVPLRFVSELMGAKVTWDQPKQSVIMEFPAVSRDVVKPIPNPGFSIADIWATDSYMRNGDAYKYGLRTVTQPARTIVVTLGKKTAMVDGQEVTIDAPPVAVPPGRVMVPVRFISETLGANVYWVGQNPIFRRADGSLGGTYQVHIYTPFHPYSDYPNWYLEHRAQKF